MWQGRDADVTAGLNHGFARSCVMSFGLVVGIGLGALIAALALVLIDLVVMAGDAAHSPRSRCGC